MTYLHDLSARLEVEGARPDSDLRFDIQLVDGPVPMLELLIRDRDSLPMYVAASASQLLSIVHLFRDQDVILSKRHEMWERMLELSIPMPLSSYGKMGDVYVVFGAMSLDSSIEDILLELKTLNDNALEALHAMESFLIRPSQAG
ncbi:DUF2170 family protein [bacterium]|nr:DUF2170 family protein [bacterium]